MNTTKILESDLADRKVSSLPTRPTAPSTFGGRGYTAAQMKEAFDRLPLFIIEKFNQLLDDIAAVGPDSLAGAIPTDISSDHTLADFFADLLTGEAANYLLLSEDGESVAEATSAIRAQIASILASLAALEHLTVNGGTPAAADDTMRFASGDAAEWAGSTRTLAKGEPALLFTEGGNVRLKVGDGEHRFSDLSSLGGDVIPLSGSSVTLCPAHAGDYRLGALASLSLRLPLTYDSDYYAFLTFDSPADASEFSVSDGTVLFTGDDVDGGVFIPEGAKHYTLMLWYDGRFQCIVRGVERDV